MTVQEILDRLNRADVAVERLLDECRSPDLSLWKQHPQLYLKFVERLIEQGHPGRALDLAREGEEHFKTDSRLQYQLALAAARGGNRAMRKLCSRFCWKKPADQPRDGRRIRT